MSHYEATDLSQALFEESGDALFLVEPESDQLLDANPTAQLLTGFTRQELLRMPATYLFRFDGKGGMARLRHAAQHTGTFHSQEGYFLRTRDDGVWVPVNLTIARMHVRPSTLGLITARDVREQREAHGQVRKMEAELRRVMSSVSDCLWSAEIDSTGQWTYRFVSPVIERITGRSADFFRVGVEAYRRVIHADDRPRWDAAITRLRTAPGSEQEYRIVRPDGSVRWVRDSIFASRDEAAATLRLDGVLTDVTGHRRAEDALRESQRALATLMTNLPGMAYRCRNDRDWTMEFVSEGAFALTGYHAEDLINNRTIAYATLIHADDQAPLWDAVQAALANRQLFQLTYRIRGAGGEERWVWEQGRGIWAESGALQALEGFIIDVTERRLAEEALRRAEAKYRSIFENALEGIYQTTPAGRFVTVNPALARILGFGSAHELLTSIDQKPRYFYANPDRRVEFVRAMEQHDAVTEFESEIVRQDGSRAWISESARTVRDATGQIIGYEGTLVDVTERRLAEEALRRERSLLRSLIDAIPDLLFYKDKEGAYLGCNAAFEKYAGLTEKDLVGRTDRDLLQRELADFYRAKDQQILTDGQPRRDEEWIGYPDGTQALVETVQTPFRDPDGRLWGLIGMCRDITERKRLEEQLRQAQKMEAIGQLAGGVAHDFNNLLTAILGNVSLLLGAKADADPDHELLAATEQAAQRATDLTRQLLGFSRQTMLRLERANLSACAQEVVSILRRTIDPRIALEVVGAVDLWAVQADLGQVNQVLMNLCLNARDAMPRGGKLALETANVVIDETRVRAHLEARPGEYVRLRVRDTGEGIPDDVRPRIFEPFFTTKGPGKGTGLGLAMVYGIVRQHQGWIECHSTVGQGTHFDIYLPRHRAAEVKAGPQPAAPSARRGHETILLVDDEAVIRNVGRAILQRQGYQVVLAEDGQEAVDIYQREHSRINLVVLDLTMPRLSGRDTLRQLRHINPDVLVLLSSGYSADHLPEAGRDGVVGFVNKPYRPQDLTAAVRAALDGCKERPVPAGAESADTWVI